MQTKNILNKYQIVQNELEKIGIRIDKYLNNIDCIFTNKFFMHIPSAITSGRFSKDTCDWYFILIYLFSTLVDNDKLDSIDIEKKHRQFINSNVIDEYIIEKHGSIKEDKFIRKREEVKKIMADTIDNLSINEIKNLKFYTITAPTGIGKTLGSLRCVNKVAKKNRRS